MFITLVLVPEATATRATPSVLRRSLEVMLEFHSRPKALQTGEAGKLVANRIVVLEVVLETPLAVECTEAQIAVHLMAI